MTIDLERVWARMLRRGDRPEIAGVRSIAADGVDLAVVTNGWSAVVVPGPWPNAAPLTIKPAVSDLLTAPPVDVVPIDMAALRQLVDGIPFNAPCGVCNDRPMPKCDLCEGTGYVECECRCGDSHERQCPDCGGRLTNRCPRCESDATYPAIQISGVRFSRDNLRQVIRWMPDEGVTWGVKQVYAPGKSADGASAGYFVAPGWWGLLMSLRSEAGSAELTFEVPGFPSLRNSEER